MTVFDWHPRCLDSHNSPMNETRPHGEPDQAAMPQRIPRSYQKKYSERRIYSKDHLLVFRLIGLPSPARRPPSHHQWVDTHEENKTEDNQSKPQDFQPQIQIHELPRIWNGFWLTARIACPTGDTPSCPLLRLSRVVLGIDIVELHRRHSVDLHHDLAACHREVVHARIEVREAPCRECRHLAFNKAIAHSDLESSRNHSYVFALRVPVRCNSIS